MLPHERRSQVTEDAGITGVIRFRRQKLTGLQILQVEVLHITKTFRAGRLEFLRYGVDWRDANDMEAAQIVLKTGFVQAGINFKVDGDQQCWDDKGNLIGNLVGGQLVRNDVEPVPYKSAFDTVNECRHEWYVPAEDARDRGGWMICKHCGFKQLPPPRKP